MSKAITNQSNSPDVPHRRVRPSVDVYENDVEYLVHVDLPGVNGDAVKLTLEQDTIALEATRRVQLNEPIIYTRTFSLPDVIDRDGVRARLEHGTMALSLPKRKSQQPRQIAVTAS
jgi:HSP20 family protein